MPDRGYAPLFTGKHFFFLNHFSMPLPWSRNLQQCHPSSNFKNWYTHQFPLENQLHIKCSFRVNFITLCHGVPNIAIRSIVSDCIACFFFALQRSPYLFGYVFRVHCVDHIPNRESQTFHVLCARTIKIICNSNQSNTQKRKHRFDIVSCFQIVATKAREVFHHDTLDFLLPHIVHQAGKCRPLEICSRKSIVEVGIHIAQFPAAVDIVLHQCDLRFHAFFCFFILNRKPPIDCRRHFCFFQFREQHRSCRLFRLREIFSTLSCHCLYPPLLSD